MPNIGSFWISWELHIPKKLGQVAIRGRKSLNVHIRNSWRTNLQLIRSIGNMIGIKRASQSGSVSQKSRWEEDHQFPQCCGEKIVEQYQKGVSQRKIAKSLKLSSSTVHNIIQRFRESGQSLCVRVKAGKPYWMPVIFGPLDGTASHTGMLL